MLVTSNLLLLILIYFLYLLGLDQLQSPFFYTSIHLCNWHPLNGFVTYRLKFKMNIPILFRDRAVAISYRRFDTSKVSGVHLNNYERDECARFLSEHTYNTSAYLAKCQVAGNWHLYKIRNQGNQLFLLNNWKNKNPGKC